MNDELRYWIDLRNRVIQKERIAFNNRLKAVERGDDVVSDGDRVILESLYNRFVVMEEELDDRIRALTEGIDIIEVMEGVRGVGKLTAAKIVAYIDIHRADTISALWRYAGYGVRDDGTRDRHVAGEISVFNKNLKRECRLLATGLMRANSPYRKIYDDAREYYDANRPDWTAAHKHNAALRKMIKMFLAHLWLVWREFEGLPTREPYVSEKLGHTHIVAPREMGWLV